MLRNALVSLLVAVGIAFSAAPLVGQPVPAPRAAAAQNVAPDTSTVEQARVPQPSAVPVAVRGVVWSAPLSEPDALADLRRIRAAGFNAVRTSPLPEALLAEADRLGLQVYAELPVDYALPKALAAARPALLRQLAALGDQARRHPSLTHVGLARRPFTRDARTCAVLRGLATAARQARLVPYVVEGAEAGDDEGGAARCAGVSLVLLRHAAQAWGDAAEVAPLRASGDSVTWGYVVGAPVREGRQGVGTPGSVEQQARVVAELLRTAPAATPVFVRQWRDGGLLGNDNPLGEAFGLHTASDRPRLALGMAAAVLSGRRDAFAYPGASAPARPESAATGWFWVALALLGLTFAAEPRLHAIVPRFFRSPSFFRDSVRDARGTMVAATLGQWAALSLVVGVFAEVLLRTARTFPVFEAFVGLLPGPVGRSVAGLAQHPALTVLLVAVGFAVVTGLWAYAFVLAARRRYHLSLWQAAMLIVWHRWAMVPLALAVLVLLRPGVPPTALLLAGLAFVAVETWGALRSALDLVLMTRLPAWLGVVLFLLPLLLALGLWTAWIGPDERAYLWWMLGAAFD